MDMWGERYPADIDVPKIFKELQPGYCVCVVCEGCRMLAVGKNEQGDLNLMFGSESEEDDFEDPWVPAILDEYNIPKNNRIKLCQKSEK
jgi:hypothetical protein